MTKLLNDEQINAIVREASRGAAIRRDGTTSQRIARAIEAAVLEAQGKQKPVAWTYTINRSHSVFSAEKPPEDAYDKGTLYPLYAAPVVQPAPEGMVIPKKLKGSPGARLGDMGYVEGWNACIDAIAAAEGKK